MPDDKKKTGKPDRRRVAGNDASEMAWLKRSMPGYSKRQLTNAVSKAGPMRKNIKAWLRKRQPAQPV